METRSQAEAWSHLCAKRVGTQRPHFFRQLYHRLRELCTHCRRQIHHHNTLTSQPDLIEQTRDVLCPSLGVDITLQVMTIALQSAGHHHAVYALLEGVKDLRHLHPT
jgi:hypothetical protein